MQELIEWAAIYSEKYPFLRKKILDLVLSARDNIDDGSDEYYEISTTKESIKQLIKEYY